MTGHVDLSGRALITIVLHSDKAQSLQEIDAWIDTGFTGDLVVPRAMLDAVGIEPCGSVDAILADGSQVELPTFACSVDWFGVRRELEVVSNDGEFPLLGVGLLLGTQLAINYGSRDLSIEPAS